MSTISKLSIQGIRSFDPNDAQVIAFHKPLTLICGSNGAGKTTIVECIKMSLTGELPPFSARGKNWIHDPKVKATRVTKACVKLQFYTQNHTKCTVARQFALEYKTDKALETGSASFSAVGSTLTCRDSKTGKDRAISLGKSKMDQDGNIPGLMGISKAILENVIFVHQEDSMWPLAESKVLKEKFDDIFAATRYSKALEAIKKLKKEQADKIKDVKINLEKDRASVKERDGILERRAKLQESVKLFEEKLEDQAQEQEKWEVELEKLAEVQQTAASLQSRTIKNKLQQEEKTASLAEARDNIQRAGDDFMEESDDEKLREWLEKLCNDGDKSRELQDKELRRESLELELENQRKYLDESKKSVWQLEQREKNHAVDCRKYEQHALALRDQLELGEDEMQHGSEDDVAQIQLLAESKLNVLEAGFAEMKDEHSRALQEHQSAANAMRVGAESSIRRLQELKQKQAKEGRELAMLEQQESQASAASSKTPQELAEQVQQLEATIHELHDRVHARAQEIDAKREQERSLRAEGQRLERERAGMDQQHQLVSRVSTLTSQLQTKQRAHQAALSGLLDEFAQTEEGQARSPRSGEEGLRQVLEYAQSQTQTLDRERQELAQAEFELKGVDGKLQALEAREADAEEQMAAHRSKMAKFCKRVWTNNVKVGYKVGGQHAKPPELLVVKADLEEAAQDPQSRGRGERARHPDLRGDPARGRADAQGGGGGRRFHVWRMPRVHTCVHRPHRALGIRGEGARHHRAPERQG